MRPAYNAPRRLTGLLMLTVAIAAFESTAVASFLPRAVQEIGGRTSYGSAFGVFLFADLVALVLAGSLLSAPRAPLALGLGVAAHATALIACGVAGSFTGLLSGRLVQGAATGVILVSLYILIGRVYDSRSRTRVLGLVSIAWSLPAVAGRVVAGALTEHIGWRSVLLPIAVVEIAALLASVPLLRHLTRHLPAEQRPPARTVLGPVALVLAGAAAATAANGVPVRLGWLILLCGVTVLVLGARGLARTLALTRAWTAIAYRGAAGGLWQGVAFLVPLSLAESHGASATAAGLALSCGIIIGVAAGGALNAGGLLESRPRRGLALAGLAGQAAGLAASGPLWLVYVGWLATGFSANIAVTAINLAMFDASQRAYSSTANATLAMAETLVLTGLTAFAALTLSTFDTDSVVVAAQVSIVVVVVILALAVGGARGTGLAEQLKERVG